MDGLIEKIKQKGREREREGGKSEWGTGKDTQRVRVREIQKKGNKKNTRHIHDIISKQTEDV